LNKGKRCTPFLSNGMMLLRVNSSSSTDPTLLGLSWKPLA
jgi:hypothetical protein